jgi:pSer/pThr/pTyr-binding forkhead associated (FHA) protein
MAMLAQLNDGVVTSRFLLDKLTHTIGRHSDNDLIIDEASVSSRHAVIEAKENDYLDGHFEYTLKDLGSTNGTFVNDIEIRGERQLGSGDMVRIAWTVFKFIDENEQQLDKTVQILDARSQ